MSIFRSNVIRVQVFVSVHKHTKNTVFATRSESCVHAVANLSRITVAPKQAINFFLKLSFSNTSIIYVSGPIISVENLAEHLSDIFCFYNKVWNTVSVSV